jgi:hypothetical protein
MKAEKSLLRPLRQTIRQHFNLEELETLAFDLGLNWDELAGATLSKKCQSLIGVMQRNGRLPELLRLLHQERPNVGWPDLTPASDGPPSNEDDPVRTAVWNALYKSLWNKPTFLNQHKQQRPLIEKFGQTLWADYFNKPIDARPQEPEQILQEIRNYFFACDDDEFYRYLLFIMNYWNELNHYKPEVINRAVNQALAKTDAGLQYVVEYYLIRYFESGSFQPIQPDQSMVTG